MTSELYKAEQAIWRQAAESLGWKFQPAYNGYVRADYHPDGPRNKWESYPSELDPEDACLVDGVETLDQAKAVIENKAFELTVFLATSCLPDADSGK